MTNAFEQQENYEEQKRQAEEMLEAAREDILKLNLHVYEGPVKNYLSEADKERFKEWFDQFVVKVKGQFPKLEVILTQDIDDALSDARSAYNASDGRGSEYGTDDVVVDIIEIKVPNQ